MDAYLPPDFPRPVVFTPAQRGRIADAFDGKRGQSRLSSAAEIAISTVVGFFLALAVGHFVFPAMFHINVSHETNVVVTTIFTVASLARGYVMRRFFNWLDHR